MLLRQMVEYSQEMNLEGEGSSGWKDSGPLNSESRCPAAAAIKYIFWICNNSISGDIYMVTYESRVLESLIL